MAGSDGPLRLVKSEVDGVRPGLLHSAGLLRHAVADLGPQADRSRKVVTGDEVQIRRREGGAIQAVIAGEYHGVILGPDVYKRQEQDRVIFLLRRGPTGIDGDRDRRSQHDSGHLAAGQAI